MLACRKEAESRSARGSSKVKAQLCSHEEEVDDEEKTEKRTLMIPGTKEGHIYAQDPLCYIPGSLLIRLSCVDKRGQYRDRMKEDSIEATVARHPKGPMA